MAPPTPCVSCAFAARRCGTVSRRAAFRCPRCLLVFCVPEPAERASAESAGRLSSETEPSYTAGLLTQAARWQERATVLAHRRGQALLDRIGHGTRLLEVGAGTGVFQAGFERAGFSYTGIDVDKRVVEAGLELDRHLQTIDFVDLRASEPFDVVAASQVFEHFASPWAFLDQAFDLLRPGGILHIDIPNHRSLAGAPSRLTPLGRSARLGGLEPPHHLMAYDEQALRHVLRSWEAIEVFRVTATDPVWGQAGAISPIARLYGRTSQLLRAEGTLVALARKPVSTS